MDNTQTSSSHAVFALKLHIVFVTKYRRKVITPEMLGVLRGGFEHALQSWRCRLLEFGGEADHVHLLVQIHPALNISELVSNMKTSSSRRIRNRFAQHIAQFYSKTVFWHRAYFVASVGSATLDAVRAYVQAQGTHEQPQKKPRKLKTKQIPC
jgi:putative transposase